MEVTKYKLTNVCDFQGGSQPPKKEWSKNKEDGFVRMLQIRDFTQREKNNVEYVKESNRLKKCKTDDVLIGRYGASIGKILTGLEGAYNVAIMKAIPNEKLLNKQYLLALLRGPIFQNFIQNIGGRAAQAGFNKEDLSKFNLSLPSLDNQKRIAQVLSNCESLIQKRKESIGLLDELLKSTFLEMFGDPIEMNKKNLEILENHIEYLTSGSRGWAKYYSDDGPKFLRIKNLGFGVLNEKDVQNVNPPKSAESIRTRVKEGDLLISITADLGRTAVIPIEYGEAYINQHLALVRLKESLNPRYAAFYFAMPFGNRMIQKKDKDGVKSGLTFKDIKNFDIYMPEIKEQKEFEIIFNQIQELKISYNNHLQELENLYGSLNQKAFKGELDLSKVKISSNLDSVIDIKMPIAGSFELPKEKDRKPKFSKKELDDLKTRPKGKRDITNITYLDFIGMPTDLQMRNYADDYSIETDFINEKLFIQFYLKDNFKNKEFTLADVESKFNSYFIPKGQDFNYEVWKGYIFSFIEAKPPLIKRFFDETDNTLKLKLTNEAFKA